MIISKDLFIFGEHIFGTIIPENTTTTAPLAVTTTVTQLQQQQQHNFSGNNTINVSKPKKNKQSLQTALRTTAELSAKEMIKNQTLIKQETVTTPETKKDIENVTAEIESREKNKKFKLLYNTPSSSAYATSPTTFAHLLSYSSFADTTSMEADYRGTLLHSNEEGSPSMKRSLIKQSDGTSSNNINRKANDFVQTEGSYAFNSRSYQEDKSKLKLLRDTLETKLVHQDAQLHDDLLNSALTQQQTQLIDPTIVSSDRINNTSNKHNHSCNINNVMLNKNSRDETVKVEIPFVTEPQRSLQLSLQNVTVLQNDRKILDDISGIVSPGEVLAIMGPSGSGKTTLLDCLSGQRRIDSGSISVNQELLSKKWRRKICYVLQDEIFFSSLTLRETVMYTALLRLPETIPKSDKVKLVDNIMQSLELTFCQHTKFGDYMNRGLSGGEKKRANIACELLTNPLLMLLDEPTSGLDSHSAISLMKILKRYAIHEQKTVVITVHQPSSQMFHMFDKLLLLYNGCTAYFGEVNNIYRYFEDIGVTIKPHYNPAEFVLEQLKSNPDIREKLFVSAKESHGNFLNRNCITQSGFINGHIVTAKSTKNSTASISVEDKNCKQHDVLINDILSSYYKDMHKSQNQNVMLADIHHQHDNESSYCEEATQQLWYGGDSKSNFSTSSDCRNNGWLDYPTRFATQFSVLSSRNFKEAKSRMLSKLNWFQTVGLALMAGAIWYNIPRTEENLHDLQGWMFFSQTYWMLFALFGALNSFPSEREVINKERRSGSYRLSAYYLAKMFGELPLVVTLPTVYLMISYPMLGCPSLKLFFLMLIFLLLNTIVAQSVGFFIGAYCMDMNVSITVSALYTLATQLFGGYLSTRIPDFLGWIRYTSMIHYAYQNMQILEFSEGSPIECSQPSSYDVCKINNTNFIPYEDILKAQNSSSPLWVNTLVLTMFFLVFRVLGYAVLRFIRCPKS